MMITSTLILLSSSTYWMAHVEFSGVSFMTGIFSFNPNIFSANLRIGFKWCFCSIAVVVTLATSTLPVLPYISSNSLTLKLSFGLWMSVLYATFPGIYAIMASGVSDAFGPGHYQANFGLMWTITVFYFAIIVPMTQVSVNLVFFSNFHSRLRLSARFWDTSGCSLLEESLV